MSKPQLLPSYDHRSLLILHSQEALARLAAGERLRLQDIDEDWELQPWADGPCLVVDHDAISIYQVDRGGWRCDDRECSDYVRTLLDRFLPAELCHGVLTKSGDRNLGSVLLDGSPFDVEPRTITLQQLESESCGSIETMTPCLGAYGGLSTLNRWCGLLHRASRLYYCADFVWIEEGVCRFWLRGGVVPAWVRLFPFQLARPAALDLGPGRA